MFEEVHDPLYGLHSWYSREERDLVFEGCRGSFLLPQGGGGGDVGRGRGIGPPNTLAGVWGREGGRWVGGLGYFLLHLAVEGVFLCLCRGRCALQETPSPSLRRLKHTFRHR